MFSTKLTLSSSVPGKVRGLLLAAPLLLATSLATQGADASLLVPVVARTASLSTSLVLTNGGAYGGWVELTYTYTLAASGTRGSATQSVLLGGRATRSFGDAIAELFGITEPSYGTISMDGIVNRVAANATLLTPAGTTQLPTVFSEEPSILHPGGPTCGKTPVERSASVRTNLILTEVNGSWSLVEAQLRDGSGGIVATQTYWLAPNEYLQINDLFGPDGFGLPPGDRYGMTVTARAISGSGAAAATTTKIDNWSGAAQIDLLGPSTGGGGSIGF